MSAPLAVDDVLQMVIGYTLNSQQLRMVLHYRVQTLGASSTAELQQQSIADFLTGSVGSPWPLLTAIRAGVTANTYFDFLQVQRVKPTRLIYARSEIDESGGIGEVSAPQNVCISFEKQSTVIGRRGVGRIQLAGLPRDDVGARVSDEWIASFGTAIRDAIPESVTVTTEDDMLLVPCLPAGGADHGYDIYNAIIRDETRTMHRRTLGLGI